MWAGKYLDHTLLKPDATRKDIETLCSEAIACSASSACTNAYWTRLVAQKLKGSNTVPCAVVGFPLGAQRTQVKAEETRLAVSDGAKEIDMVINVGALKMGGELDQEVFEDIQGVVQAAQGKIVKVILESCFLSNDEIVKACQLAVRAGADFVKTSTGFASGGATVEHVRLMRETVDNISDKSQKRVRVKASGGIRDLQQFIKMIEAGAERIGCSKGVEILKELGKTPIPEPKYQARMHSEEIYNHDSTKTKLNQNEY